MGGEVVWLLKLKVPHTGNSLNLWQTGTIAHLIKLVLSSAALVISHLIRINKGLLSRHCAEHMFYRISLTIL